MCAPRSFAGLQLSAPAAISGAADRRLATAVGWNAWNVDGVSKVLAGASSPGGMPPLEFFVALFRGPMGFATQADRDHSRELLLLALDFLSQCNESWFKRYPNFPKLYDCAVVYFHDDGVEKWYDAQNALERLYGDCKVFCAWLCAELRVRGIAAMPHIKWRQMPNGTWMYHCLIAVPRQHLTWLLQNGYIPFLDTPNGQIAEPSKIPGDTDIILDPSRAKGMGWEPAFKGTNRRPASPEFVAQLTRILGRSPRSGADLVPAAAGYGSTAWPYYLIPQHRPTTAGTMGWYFHTYPQTAARGW